MIKEIVSQKKEGWIQALETQLQAKGKTPLKWGINDCVTSTCNDVVTMTGRDPAYWCRDKYNNKFGAFKVLDGFLGLSLIETFSKVFMDMGFIEVESPESGDIAFVRIQNLDEEASRMFGGVTMVTVVGNGAVVAPGKEGLMLIENYELVKAWTL